MIPKLAGGWRGLVQLGVFLMVPLVVRAEPPATLSLPDCLALARQRQPVLAAHRASLAAAIEGSHALDKLRVPRLLAKDLPCRRQQAALGVEAARARLTVAEFEVDHAVTRTYLAAVYARQQQESLEDYLDNLRERTKILTQQLEDAQKLDKAERARFPVTPRHTEALGILIEVIDAQLEGARQGERRAVAALREALALEPCFAVQLADRRLPTLEATIRLESALELALSRRGELVLVDHGVEIIALEVGAQCAQRGPKGRTFATGADLHAQDVPAGSYGNDYRPGAVGLEMPELLAGSRCGRVEKAQALAARADGAAAKARQLIALEVEDAWRRWQVARSKSARLTAAADQAEELSRELWTDFAQGGKVPLDDLIQTEATAAQLRAQAIEAHYELLLALSALERMTAGGLGLFRSQESGVRSQ